jgi:hypothetical protein
MTIEEVKTMVDEMSNIANDEIRHFRMGLISESDMDKNIDRIYVNFVLSLCEKLRA